MNHSGICELNVKQINKIHVLLMFLSEQTMPEHNKAWPDSSCLLNNAEMK